jgi:hypothetical protein
LQIANTITANTIVDPNFLLLRLWIVVLELVLKADWKWKWKWKRLV